MTLYATVLLWVRRTCLATLVGWSLPQTLAAQDLCSAATDLHRLFHFLRTDVASDGSVGPQHRQDINTISARYTAFSVEFTFRRSSLAPHLDQIVDAFAASQDMRSALDRSPPDLRVLQDAYALQSMTRAQILLTRIECQPPVGEATEPAPNSDLPQSSSALQSGHSIGNIRWLLKSLAAGLVIGVLAAAFTIAYRLAARAASRNRRYICSVKVRFYAAGDDATKGTALAQDISRNGTKIGEIGGDIPRDEAKLDIWIGQLRKSVTVRWSNAHFFGGQFETPLSRAELRSVLTLKPKARRRRKPRRIPEPLQK